jgi:hypothetical protein
VRCEDARETGVRALNATKMRCRADSRLEMLLAMVSDFAAEA